MCKTCRRESVEAEQSRGVRELQIELDESEYDSDADFNEEGDYADE